MADITKELAKAEELMNQGEFNKAARKYKSLIKENPDVSEIYFGLASAMEFNPKAPTEDIIKNYEQALKLDPENINIITSYGAFCLDMGKFDKAEECYMKAADLDDENDYRYISEFAIEYAKRAPENLERFVTPQTKDMVNKKKADIYKKSLSLILDALSLSPEKAMGIIKEIK